MTSFDRSVCSSAQDSRNAQRKPVDELRGLDYLKSLYDKHEHAALVHVLRLDAQNHTPHHLESLFKRMRPQIMHAAQSENAVLITKTVDEFRSEVRKAINPQLFEEYADLGLFPSNPDEINDDIHSAA